MNNLKQFIEKQREEFNDRFRIRIQPKAEEDMTKAFILEQIANKSILKDFADFWLSKQKSLVDLLIEEAEGRRNTNHNGKGLPYENAPEIYGNSRIEAYKSGYNSSLDDQIKTLKDLRDSI